MMNPNDVLVMETGKFEVLGNHPDVAAARHAVDTGEYGEGSFDLLTVREVGRSIRSTSKFAVTGGKVASRIKSPDAEDALVSDPSSI